MIETWNMSSLPRNFVENRRCRYKFKRICTYLNYTTKRIRYKIRTVILIGGFIQRKEILVVEFKWARQS